MRVALVCPYSLSVFGGVQSQVLALARTLRELDVSATVIAPGDRDAADPDTIIVGRAIGVPANGSVAPIAPLPPAWARTWRELRAGDFDVVHVHEPFVPGPGLAAVVRSPAPVVGTFHQSGWGWPYRLSFPVVRALGRRLAAAVAVSDAAAEMVRDPLGRGVEILWNGVESPPTPPAMPTSGPTISFVGRHERRKGLEILLEASARLPADTRFWIMGDGPLTAELRRAYAHDGRIEWLGRVPDAERDARLASSDLYCAPNLGGESFGLVLAEAMAAGAAVVASDLAAFRAVARPERDEAILVPPGDPLALAAALRVALDDPSRRRRMRAAGLARSAELSMDRLARRYLEIYRGVGVGGADGGEAVSDGQLG